MNYKLYTDGSCYPNPGPGGWAYILLSDEHELKNNGCEQESTNNRMELTSLIKGLEHYLTIRGTNDNITVYSDSNYLIHGTTKWSKKWEKNKWIKEIKNKDLWMYIRPLDDAAKPQFQWIKGHSGNIYNELVDRMALRARTQIQVI